jgi:hypothetical protein
VRALFDRSVKTMPPSAPGSLPKESYANVVAYILEANGFRSGETPMPVGGAPLDPMVIRK